MKGRLKEILRLAGGEWVISLTTRNDPRKQYDRLKDFDIEFELKKATNPRSKDANAFCWAMCSDIGKAITPPVPKEEVYRKAIREVGEYEPLPIRNDAVETFQERWSEKGTGWFAEVIDDSKLKGYKLVFAYYGSSTYDTAAMSRVIEYLKDEMEQMGLPLKMSKEDEERMLSEWGKALSRKTEAVTCAAG